MLEDYPTRRGPVCSCSEVEFLPSGGVRVSSVSTPQSDLAEHALMNRLRAGEEAAFVDLIERYHAPLFRLAKLYVASDAIAQEVVQETWLGVLEGLSAFEGRSSVKTWIFRILSNRAKSRGVREGRSVAVLGLTGLEDADGPAVDPSRFAPSGNWIAPPQTWEADGPSARLDTKESLSCLRDALAELPDAQRAVVTLRDLEGLDADEVSSLLEISEGNQRVLLHRARSRLREKLEAYAERR